MNSYNVIIHSSLFIIFIFIYHFDNLLYEILSVDSDTQITLTTPYQGKNVSKAMYSITTGYTQNLRLNTIDPGDKDWPLKFTQLVLRPIDDYLQNNIVHVAVRSVTGHTTTPDNGLIEINTYDNTVCIYGEGVWNQLCFWTT